MSSTEANTGIDSRITVDEISWQEKTTGDAFVACVEELLEPFPITPQEDDEFEAHRSDRCGEFPVTPGLDIRVRRSGAMHELEFVAGIRVWVGGELRSATERVSFTHSGGRLHIDTFASLEPQKGHRQELALAQYTAGGHLPFLESTDGFAKVEAFKEIVDHPEAYLRP
ncbi:MAG TPA: hypothetical protein VIF43_01295 [Patescibacteria group bacterium]